MLETDCPYLAAACRAYHGKPCEPAYVKKFNLTRLRPSKAFPRKISVPQICRTANEVFGELGWRRSIHQSIRKQLCHVFDSHRSEVFDLMPATGAGSNDGCAVGLRTDLLCQRLSHFE